MTFAPSHAAEAGEGRRFVDVESLNGNISMLAASSGFSAIAAELEHLHLRRESVMHGAFESLLECCPGLAALLLEGLGDARRAAVWLSSRQRAFSGRTAWDLLAEGDDDEVWDAAGRLIHLTADEG